jgi:hypothetical protein
MTMCTQHFGECVIVEESGKGGLGTVYRAVHATLGCQALDRETHERAGKAFVAFSFFRELCSKSSDMTLRE